MLKHPPPKLARFLVWASAKDEYREDILIAFDEMHFRVAEEFGDRYAACYSMWQGLRSLPFGALLGIVRLASAVTKLVGN